MSKADADETTPVDEHRDDDDDAFPSADELLGSFLEEASLWPVLLVAIGSGGAFLAAALILAIVDRNPFAIAALVLVLGMTADIVLRARREAGSRNIAKLIGLIWLAAVGFAGLAVWSGIAFG